MTYEEFQAIKKGDKVAILCSLEEYSRLTKRDVTVNNDSPYSHFIESMLNEIIEVRTKSQRAVQTRAGWQIYHQALTKITKATHPEYYL